MSLEAIARSPAERPSVPDFEGGLNPDDIYFAAVREIRVASRSARIAELKHGERYLGQGIAAFILEDRLDTQLEGIGETLWQ